MSNAPRLRADLNIVEQIYRNEQSFVVKDPTTQAYFRFRPVEVQVMKLFDGMRSASQVAEQLVAAGVRVSASTVDGFARKLATLGLLERTLMERTTQQLERLRAERGRQRSLVRGELFRIRFPFGDPNDRLTAWYPKVRWCFTRPFVIVSLLLFAMYAGIVVSQREQLARETSALLSAPLPWLVFVLFTTLAVLTAIHEFGHAFACKHFGGDVREMGAMLIFFTPAFYANVNDAWSFSERSARLWVTFAGPWIELFVTTLMALLWMVIAPGSVLGEFAVASMFIGGVANLLTNFNPLLPLDGYFALGDWLEIPNLRHRARAYAGAWTRHYLLREDIPLPEMNERERRILLAYGVLAFIYSTLFLLLLASKAISAVDRLLGALAATLVLLGVMFLMRNVLTATASATRLAWRSNAQRWRTRRTMQATMTVAVVLVVLSIVPCHLTASGEFRLMPVVHGAITAPGPGVVAAVYVREHDELQAGVPVLQLVNRELVRDRLSRTRVADSLAALAQIDASRMNAGEMAYAQIQASSATAGAGALEIREGLLRMVSRFRGVVLTPRPEQLTGHRVATGDTLLTVADTTQMEAVIRLRGAGAVNVAVGDTVRLVSYSDVTSSFTGRVSSLSPVAGDVGAIDVRVPVSTALRAGTTGDARVLWQRASALGAIWWFIRSALRNDLLL